MRVLWLALLLAPLSGCIGGPAATGPALLSLWNLPEGDPEPVPVGDCQELLRVLNDRAIAWSDLALEQGGYRWYGRESWFNDGDLVSLASADSAGTMKDASAHNAEVTGTNNQEAGVDEADVLKTDGEWTYVIQGDTLRILHSENVGDVAAYSRITLDGYGGTLLLEAGDPDDPDDDRLLVITQTWTDSAYSSGKSLLLDYYGHQSTHIQVLGLEDRRSPELLNEMWIPGSLQGARLIDGTAYVVSHEWERNLPLQTYVYPNETFLAQRGLSWREYIDMTLLQRAGVIEDLILEAKARNRMAVANLTLDDHIPRVERLDLAGDRVPEPFTDKTCARFLSPPESTGRGVNTIVALDIAGNPSRSSLTQILGSTPIVYGAADALVLSAPSRDAWWFWSAPDLDEATDVQWFDLDGLSVRHRASGRIPGTVQDSFGIDVHDGTLRIATTTGQWGRWWLDDPEPMMNHLTVLGATAGTLTMKGIVGGIAPGERIWSARFTDDRAYLVTFQQIDPLWIIDLSDPAAPTILGELEIPGVSTYIHPISDDLLLTIGMGAQENGLGLEWSSIQVSLFDISNPAKPRRADVLDIAPGGSGWSWSGAMHEHKAFTYWGALEMLAIPVSTSHGWSTNDWDWHYTHQMSLRLVHVDTDAKDLSIYGSVNQDALDMPEDQYWGGEIQRSYFLGYPKTGPVSVYAMSDLGMTAHDLDTLAAQDAVAFE